MKSYGLKEEGWVAWEGGNRAFGLFKKEGEIEKSELPYLHLTPKLEEIWIIKVRFNLLSV